MNRMTLSSVLAGAVCAVLLATPAVAAASDTEPPAGVTTAAGAGACDGFAAQLPPGLGDGAAVDVNQLCEVMNP